MHTTETVIDPRTGETLLLPSTPLTEPLLQWLKSKGIEQVHVAIPLVDNTVWTMIKLV